MMMRLNLSFSLKEARQIVNEIQHYIDNAFSVPDEMQYLLKLQNKLNNPLQEEVKIEAQPANPGSTE